MEPGSGGRAGSQVEAPEAPGVWSSELPDPAQAGAAARLVSSPKAGTSLNHQLRGSSSLRWRSVLADIQYRLAHVMQNWASIEKEYMMCFSEAEHFHHIHIHFVAKPRDLPQEAKGPGIFSYLKVDQQSAVPPDEIKALSEELKEILSTSVFTN